MTMNVLKKDTPPIFEIVPRCDLDTAKVYTVVFFNEYTSEIQTVTATVAKLQNENYNLILSEFPNGEKLSFEIKDSDLVVCMGKLIIIGQSDSVQDYEANNNQYY
jgi:hypothetical protein